MCVRLQYRSAIFYYTPEQKAIAEQVTKAVQTDPAKMKAYEGPTITTEIR